jgi:hypothetical protein
MTHKASGWVKAVQVSSDGSWGVTVVERQCPADLVFQQIPAVLYALALRALLGLVAAMPICCGNAEQQKYEQITNIYRDHGTLSRNATQHSSKVFTTTFRCVCLSVACPWRLARCAGWWIGAGALVLVTQWVTEL